LQNPSSSVIISVLPIFNPFSMQVKYQYKNLSGSEQGLFDDYMPKKLPQIESLLTKYAEDAAMLDIRIEKFDKHDAYEVELVLKLPMKTLKAKETSHNITKAVDFSKDRLIAQIKKFQGTMKKEQLMARRHASIRKPAIHEKVNVEDIHTKKFMEA
jgi:ribosome-associated translation inhibitor RaiA